MRHASASAGAGSWSDTSSKSATPREPAQTGTHGTTCFCPVSAIAANHGPRRGSRIHARIAGFSPFDAMITSGLPSSRVR